MRIAVMRAIRLADPARGRLNLHIGFVRMVFLVRLAGIAAQAAARPAMHVVLPVIGAVFLLVGGVLSFKVFARD